MLPGGDPYEAVARGDGRQLASALTPSTRWIMPGRAVLSGTSTGPDEIFGLWKRISEQSGYHVKSATFIYEDPQAYDEFWR
jgi:hypothetical protein